MGKIERIRSLSIAEDAAVRAAMEISDYVDKLWGQPIFLKIFQSPFL